MMLREALRHTPADPAVKWLGRQVRYYRRPRLVRQNDVYDRQTIEILRQTPGNYLDVGAAGGTILREMIRVAPTGRHVAFEPIPQMAERIRSRFPAVELHQVALSDAPGEATFHFAHNDPGRSGLRRIDYERAPDIETIRVRVDTLDNLVHHAVQALKIDVEGAEYAVLCGGRRLLSECRPVVVFEHGTAARHFGVAPHDVFDLLDGLDYRVNLMSRWLRRRPPLSRKAFSDEATHRNWYFIAFPR